MALIIIIILLMLAFYGIMIFFNEINIRIFDAVFFLGVIIFLSVPLFFSLAFADKINEKLIKQRYIMAQTMLQLKHEENHRPAGSKCSPKMINRSVSLMQSILTMMQNDKFQIRLLGYNIDATVTGIIATVIGSAGFAVARLVADGV